MSFFDSEIEAITITIENLRQRIQGMNKDLEAEKTRLAWLNVSRRLGQKVGPGCVIRMPDGSRVLIRQATAWVGIHTWLRYSHQKKDGAWSKTVRQTSSAYMLEGAVVEDPGEW